MKAKITDINPEELIKKPAFSQAVITEGNGRAIYVGGQNAIDIKGNLVGKRGGHIQKCGMNSLAIN